MDPISVQAIYVATPLVLFFSMYVSRYVSFVTASIVTPTPDKIPYGGFVVAASFPSALVVWQQFKSRSVPLPIADAVTPILPHGAVLADPWFEWSAGHGHLPVRLENAVRANADMLDCMCGCK